MMRRLFLTALTLCFIFSAAAFTSRSLIIGIDIYKPAGQQSTNSARLIWRNLNGCVNDAMAIKELAIAKYGFQPLNITSLSNQEASRERILAELKKLVEVSQNGDVVFIFYAGHGSQVVNSLSLEKDKKDETIVPADSFKGAPDIRDKELSVYFNQLIDKGVLLTVILDSCHSGSVGRGLYETTAVRFLEGNPLDVKDAFTPQPPEERGALIISAAQDFEFAKEIKDENNIEHGAFTLALIKAMQQNSVDASAEELFGSAQAIMKFFGKTQEPVLAANEQRKESTLFGLPKGVMSKQLAIPVTSIQDGKVEIMGGFASGLSVGVQLKSSGNDTLEIAEMKGPNKSVAVFRSSKSNQILPGTLLQVISWATSAGPALRVYLPAKGLEPKALLAAVQASQKLYSSKQVQRIDNISEVMPDRLFSYNEATGWYEKNEQGKKIIGATFSPSASKMAAGTSVYVNFPPSTELVASLKEELQAYNNIEIVNAPEESVYALAGRLNAKNELEYAFVRTQAGALDTSESLPLRTNFEQGASGSTKTTAAKLVENLFRIAKIRAWLLLQPPTGDNIFPFALQVQHYRSGQVVENNQVQLGDTLSFYLVKKEGERWNRRKRYTYVFSIDGQGAMKLLFPRAAGGSVENRLPQTNDTNTPEERTHLADILVRPPLGLDNYFLLTSDEPIGNLSAFQQSGVVSRGPAPSETQNPLEALLFTGAKSRNKVTTPLNWSIEKLILKSTEKK